MKTTVIHHSADYDGIFCREIAKKFLPDAELIGWDFKDKPIPLPQSGLICGCHKMIKFPIRHLSWCRRAYTSYGWTDVIRNDFAEGELQADSVVKEFLTTAADGKSYTTKFHNLDVIISVGYWVKSHRGTQFRIWATKWLREYNIVKGFTMDDERLKNPPGKHLIMPANKSIRGLLTVSEAELLKCMRFNLRKELKRELVEERGVSLRMGTALCDGYHRIVRLAERVKGGSFWEEK